MPHNIGVGIRGKEGGASVQASDFAISQFRFLEVLLFCHGRSSYRRIAFFIQYIMYKSVVIGWPYLIHAYAIRFVGNVPFAPLLDTMYAPLSSWSVAVILAFDHEKADAKILATEGRYLDAFPLAHFVESIYCIEH